MQATLALHLRKHLFWRCHRGPGSLLLVEGRRSRVMATRHLQVASPVPSTISRFTQTHTQHRSCSCFSARFASWRTGASPLAASGGSTSATASHTASPACRSFTYPRRRATTCASSCSTPRARLPRRARRGHSPRRHCSHRPRGESPRIHRLRSHRPLRILTNSTRSRPFR